jgi:hypothetical protein
VSRSVKGQITWECTVDGEGFEEQEILFWSNSLVTALRLRYPLVELRSVVEEKE